MKVTKAVNYFIDYRKANSKKKYDKEPIIYTHQVPEPIPWQRIRLHNLG